MLVTLTKVFYEFRKVNFQTSIFNQAVSFA